MSAHRSPQERANTTSVSAGAGPSTPILSASGTAPPTVTMSESSYLNSALRVELTTPGVLGIALFRWNINGGSFVTGVNAGASVPLVGLLGAPTLNFSAGTYSADNVYTGVI